MTAINLEVYRNQKVLAMVCQEGSDISIVSKAIAGEKDAFALLVQKYQNKVYQVLYFMLHHPEDSLDLAQDTFIKAYKSLKKLRAPEAFYSWLIKIAVNLALNHLKKNKRLQKYQEELSEDFSSKVEEPINVLEQGEMQEQLRNLIAALPDKQRIALVLCDMESYSYKEIAQMLQCRMGTVMSRIYYARDFIRKNLQSQKENHPPKENKGSG